MAKLRDMGLRGVRGWKTKPAKCVVCGATFAGVGYFCRAGHDELERVSRVGNAVMRGMRDVVRAWFVKPVEG